MAFRISQCKIESGITRREHGSELTPCCRLSKRGFKGHDAHAEGCQGSGRTNAEDHHSARACSAGLRDCGIILPDGSAVLEAKSPRGDGSAAMWGRDGGSECPYGLSWRR